MSGNSHIQNGHINENGHIKVEVGADWALIVDTKQMNFGEVRRIRQKASSGDEESVMQVAASLIDSWEAHDVKTGEVLGTPSLETLDRTAPAFGLAIVQAVGEGLQASVPLLSTKASGPS